MPTTNEIIQSELMNYSVQLDRYSHGINRETIKIFKMLEKELIIKLNEVDLTRYQQQRLQRLLNETKSIIGEAYSAIAVISASQLSLLPAVEIAAVVGAINLGIGDASFAVDSLTPTEPRRSKSGRVFAAANATLTPEYMKAIVSDILISGASVKEWWKRQESAATKKFSDSVRMGLVQGETTNDIVRRIRGTRARQYKDGIMAISQRNAETLILSAAAEVSDKTRNEVLQQNKDIIKYKQWISVLDKRTSEICRARSGLLWTMENKPIKHKKPFLGGPPAHMRCRSFVNVVIKDFEDEGLQNVFESELRKMDFSEDQIKAARMNAQASMDGQVPAGLNYSDWLKTKPIDFQKDVLGDKKWQLWDSGKIEMRDLIDNRGRPLNYEQLVAKFGK